MGLTPDGNVIGATVSEPAGRPKKTSVVLERQAVLEGPKMVADLIAGRIGVLNAAATHTGPLVPMIPRYQNYFHWLIECLPRLRGVRALEDRTDLDVSLLVPADLPEWIAQSLMLVGFPKDRLVPAEAPLYHTSNLVVPSFPLPTPAECAWLRTQVLERAPEDVGVETGANVYISRAGATERTVRNENAVVSTLSEYGFESYRLEELSVAAQARLFDEADLIVGAHGAGLSNLVFCTDGAALELFGSKVKSNYANIADTVGVQYESLQCSASGVDLVVDTDRLIDVIDTLDDRI
jgi:capsular polysaccharide biosynthesis protein